MTDVDTFQWARDGVDIAGATNPSRVTSGEIGSVLTLKGWRNGIPVVTSSPFGPIQATPTPPSGDFWSTPDDLRALTPDVEFTGGSAAQFQAFLDSLDGTTKRLGGIRWGVSVDRGLAGNWRLEHHGSDAAHPIRLFPTNIPATYVPGGEPLIKGRMVFYSTSGKMQLSWLKLDGEHDPSGNTSSWTIAGPDIVFDRVRMFQSNPATHGTIAFSPIAGSYGNGDRAVLKYSKIHDIGQKPVANTSSPGFYMHGVYAQALQLDLHDVWAWNCSRIGLMFRGAQNSQFIYFASDRNGAGAAFADNGSSGDQMNHGIVTNSNEQLHNDDWGVAIYNPSGGNHFDHMGSHGNHLGDFDTGAGVTNGGSNLTGDPVYTHPVDANPALVDLRPTDAAYIAAALGARQMIPF